MAWDKTQNHIGFAFSKESWTSEKAIHNLSDWITLKMSQLNQYVDEFIEKLYAAGHPDEIEEETEKLRKSLLHFRTVEWWINCEKSGREKKIEVYKLSANVLAWSSVNLLIDSKNDA